MKVAIVLNGISRKKKRFYRKILPPLQACHEVVVKETEYAGHAPLLAKEFTKDHDVVLAAGGDGTLNQVLNGMLSSERKPLPAIGIVPLGTGNDFARMCGIRADGDQLSALIQNASFQPTDVGRINSVNNTNTPITRYFLNVCSLGMGPDVVARLSKSNRALGPALTYLKAITQTFFSHKPQPVQMKAEVWEWSGQARVVAIANGKSFGNGLYIAPDADLADGAFATFIASDLPLLKFLLYLQTIKSGKKLKDDKIHYHTAHTISLTSSIPTVIEAEGELQGHLPAMVTLVPHAIRVVR